MDFQDPDYYSANTLVYNEVGDIAWKKIRKKIGQLILCFETSFSKNSYHIETSRKSIDRFLYHASFYWKVFSNRL